MNTVIKLLAILALTLGALPAHAAGAETSHFIFNTHTAWAFFESYDSSGCIGTFVFVFADDGSGKFGLGQPTVVASTLILWSSQFDICTQTSLFSGFSLVPLSADEFQIDEKLNSATLNTTLEVCCDSSGHSFQVPVGVDWTGGGDTFRAKDHIHDKTPGFEVNFKSKGTSRNAGASGSISIFGTNLIPVPAYSAGLELVKTGEVDIIH